MPGVFERQNKTNFGLTFLMSQREKESLPRCPQVRRRALQKLCGKGIDRSFDAGTSENLAAS